MPSCIFFQLICIIDAGTSFISNTFMLRYALNGINEGKTFEKYCAHDTALACDPHYSGRYQYNVLPMLLQCQND